MFSAFEKLDVTSLFEIPSVSLCDLNVIIVEFAETTFAVAFEVSPVIVSPAVKPVPEIILTVEAVI